MHYSLAKPQSIGASLGAILTVIYSSESVASKPSSRPVGILPLLVILFIVSYGILTMLVFEQGQTIESQRSLIREMLKDSTQLATLKDKMARADGNPAQSKVAPPAEQTGADSVAPPAGAKGSDKAPKVPSKSTRSMKVVPEKPAGDLEDVRRSTRVI